MSKIPELAYFTEHDGTVEDVVAVGFGCWMVLVHAFTPGQYAVLQDLTLYSFLIVKTLNKPPPESCTPFEPSEIPRPPLIMAMPNLTDWRL